METILVKATRCVDEDLRFAVSEDDRQPGWKTAFLIALAVKTVIKLAAVLHQRSYLRDDGKIEQKYTKLPVKVTEILPIEQLKDARVYNRGINCVDIIWHIANFVFDFAVILLDFPAFIWYGWIEVNHQCDTESEYGIWD